MTSMERFHPLIARWFTARYGRPTGIQQAAWEAISSGEHVLLTAPTGSGKTLAAFLWAINQLVTGAWTGDRLRILYVSPLKALGNDIRRNLELPLTELAALFAAEGSTFPYIQVATRSGDTEQSDRQRMYRRPPAILITTPESLNILVTSKSGRALLGGVAVTILDEIHAVVPEKRGVLLMSAVERLALLGGEFQRIALSATVRPMSRVASFIGGQQLHPGGGHSPRQVRLVTAQENKHLEIRVHFPATADGMPVAGGIWPGLIDVCREEIARGEATLLFTNSRRLAEKTARLLNEEEDEVVAYSHHGSLSREIRLAVEEKLKSGELKAIVATNSLELGIDIGQLDQVVLLGCPSSVASAIQKVGRAGHQVGAASRGLLLPMYGKDLLNAVVLAGAVARGDIEEVQPVASPLDVLAQVLLAMTVAESWQLDDLYDAIRCCSSFQQLSRRQFELVIEMLAGRYGDTRIGELAGRLHLDRLTGNVVARKGTAYLLYTGGGTIPDRGFYQLRHQQSRAVIGELDEEFVWERSLGETFSLGTQVWQINTITHNDVEVVPVSTSHNIIPFWKGDGLQRGFHLSQALGLFLQECEARHDGAGFTQWLAGQFFMDQETAARLASYLQRQRRHAAAPLPHRYHLLVEHYHDPQNSSDAKQVVLHTFWGGPCNQPFALALAAAWEQRYGYPLEVFADNDCVLVLLPHEFGAESLLSLVTSTNLESLLRQGLEKTGLFGALFRESCGRAMLLPKTSHRRRMPLWLNRLRSRKLLEAVLAYDDFPILLETWRECLHDRFDLVNLRVLLDELEQGQIQVGETVTSSPSPFADGVIWRQTNKLMYEDDTPTGGKNSSLADSLLKEVVFSAELRPAVEPAVVARFLTKVQRTAEGYAPCSTLELIDWVDERLLLPWGEWQELLAAMVRDGEESTESLLAGVAHRLVAIDLPGAKERLVISLVNLPLVAEAFALEVEELRLTALAPITGLPELVQQAIVGRGKDREEEYRLPDLLANWLNYYGPQPLRLLPFVFGLSELAVTEAVAELTESGTLVAGELSQGSDEQEICSAQCLEVLLRMGRRARRAESFEPLGPEKLALFLAQHQGVGQGVGSERLQECLEPLFGFPAPCNAWEEDILPARLQPYYQAHLDSLLQSSGLLWFGCGRQRITFTLEQDLELFTAALPDSLEERSKLEQLLPTPQASSSFFELAATSGLDSAALTEKLWQWMWLGLLRCDSFSLLRQGIANNFKPLPAKETGGRSRRRGLERWRSSRPVAGSFARLPDIAGEEDPLLREELGKDRVRQLLARYGIVCRDLLVKELEPMQYRAIARSLRLMELSGEVVAGYFFHGLQGPQFLSHDSYRRLQQGLEEERIFWLNACDPASLCGLGGEELRAGLPPRLTGNYLVYHGSRLCLIIRRQGRELTLLVDPSHPLLGSYLQPLHHLVSRECNPLPRVLVESVNGMPVVASPYLQALLAFGFRKSHRGLEMDRSG